MKPVLYLDNCSIQRPLDSKTQLRIALEAEAVFDYFCTCDDDFLKKAKKISNLRVKVVSPLELAEEL